jgi:hypothetical protein
VSAPAPIPGSAPRRGRRRSRPPLSMPPGPPTAATPGTRVGVLRFDQAQAEQSPVLIHALDCVAVRLQLADHGRWGVKPSRAQRGKRHRLLTSPTQLLKRQTMLSLDERHRTELSISPATPIRAPHAPIASASAAPARGIAGAIERSFRRAPSSPARPSRSSKAPITSGVRHVAPRPPQRPPGATRPRR